MKNKVPDLRLIEGKEIKSIEPYCHGLKAIHSPHTGIVDWALVTQYYAKDFANAGGTILNDFKVENFVNSGDAEYPVTIVGTNRQIISSKYVLTCGGLHADKLAELSGNKNSPKIGKK